MVNVVGGSKAAGYLSCSDEKGNPKKAALGRRPLPPWLCCAAAGKRRGNLLRSFN